jgi:glucan phosphoethanolaminetransferase (alkaline phosphatase superfamily)
MDKNREEDQAKAFGLIVLSALCLSYSGFQTYQGYSTDLGFTNSLVLSIILTFAMFLLSMTLRIDIKRGHSQNKIVPSALLSFC